MERFLEISKAITNHSCDSFFQREENISKKLEFNSSTQLIFGLQSLNWEKAIVAIGLFSLFESNIQSLFPTEKSTLSQMLNTLRNSGNNYADLVKNFEYYRDAINTLKHGKGKSYDSLVEKVHYLPFEITLPNFNFRDEGDVSEISTLVKVDEIFITNLMDILEQCYQAIQHEQTSSWEQKINNTFDTLEKSNSNNIIASFNKI